jgi:hypothetical protein
MDLGTPVLLAANLAKPLPRQRLEADLHRRQHGVRQARRKIQPLSGERRNPNALAYQEPGLTAPATTAAVRTTTTTELAGGSERLPNGDQDAKSTQKAKWASPL